MVQPSLKRAISLFFGNIMNKVFKSFDEQIKLLKSRNLSFWNGNSDLSQKVKWYLSKYNYHNFINGYIDPFMVNFDRHKNFYRSEVNVQYIIDLFNFDRSLSSVLINDILTIERNFSTQICYFILNKYKDIYDAINKGTILKLNENELLEMFPGLKEINLCRNVSKDIILNENINKFKKIILGYSSESNKVFKKYKNKEEYPLWALSIYWSFGDACFIFSILNNELKEEITLNYFDKKIDNYDGLIESFWSIMNV